jgi:3-phosphoshikimate 1-carboxyvinyltransferase
LGLLVLIGARVRTSEQNRVIRVTPGLRAFDLAIEPDASGATYFWAAAALVPGATVRVEGLGGRSLQGDAGFVDLLARLGAAVRRSDDDEAPWLECKGPETLSPTLADMSNMPDAAMTLAACCAFAGGTSILRGVRTLRVKECDRIAALETELGKIGVGVSCDINADSDTMTISPPAGGVPTGPGAGAVVFETYDDHRMAMALALVGLRRPNVSVANPRCVEKTYPGFWADLARLYE